MISTRRGGEARRLQLEPTRPQVREPHREYEAIAWGQAIARGEEADRRLGSLTAMQVEDSIQRQGWPEGAVCGPEEAIASNFGVGVRLMRQAFRILEARGACRQQRGRGGGLVVLRPSPRATAAALADHLRWTGATSEHIREARLFFQALVAETITHSHMRAGQDNPVLALIQACLDELPDGRARTDWVEGSPLDEPEHTPPSNDRDPPPLSLRPLAQDPKNLAAAVADRIGRSISYEACRAQRRLGSLWELAETHGVSLSVTIAAIRILEDAGVVSCQKGRNGGVRLRAPDGDPLVGLVHGYLAAWRATEPQCVSICHRLNLRATERVALTRGDALLAELETIHRRMSAAQGFGVMEAWYALQRALHDGAGNPVLHLITRCLGGYAVRAFVDPVTPPSSELLARMVQTAGAVVEGVRRGDVAMALEAQGRTRMALDERRRQRAPTAMAS